MDYLAEPVVARQLERSQKPRPAGVTGRGLGVRSPSRIKMRRRPDYRSGGLRLLDHLNDAAGTRFDQHGLAVHHRVTIRSNTVGLRHVVIGDAGLRQHAADDHAVRNGVTRHALAHDILTERWALRDGDALIV